MLSYGTYATHAMREVQINMGKKTKTEIKAPKKKAFKWWILFIILALICGAIVFCVYRIKHMNVNYEKTISAPASFKKTSKKVIDVITAEQEEFSNATPEERKKIAKKIMDDFIEQGVLKEENIGFDEENNVYQFVTNDGALNLISLNDFDPEYMGAIDGKSDSGNGAEETGSSEGGITGIEGYQYFLNGYPYTEEALMAEDLDMLFFTEIVKDPGDKYNAYHNQYNNNIFPICEQAQVRYKDIPQTTVDELKTCLKGHDFISMDFHGLPFSDFASGNQVANSFIPFGILNPFSMDLINCDRLKNYLEEKFDEENTTFLLLPENVNIATDIKYADDLANGRVVRSVANFGYTYAVTPLFFYDYYDENDLKGTIVYLGACDGYMNEALPATFKACGAAAVVGYNHSVHTNYANDMQWRFLHWLMWGGTVEEALEFAKSIVGEKDQTAPYAELKIYPKGKDAVLIKNAECTRKYVLIEESMSYEEAVKYCKDSGGRIASVQYPAEQRALKALLEKGEKNCYWIGLQKGDDGTLRWESDGSEQIYFLPWAANEPSGDGAHVVVYGRLDEKGRSKSGEWNDVTYDPNMHEGFYAAEQFGIVCELSGTDATAVGIPEETEIKTGQEQDDENTPAKVKNEPKWVRTKETCYEYDWYFTDGAFEYSWEYEYDAVGKLTKMTNYIVGWSNDIVSDHYHEYVYDTVGNMISDTDYFADGRWYYWFDYEYDSNGLMTKKIYNCHVNTNNGDPFGSDIHASSEDVFEYDEYGRLKKEIHYDSYNKLDDWSEKEYDIAGNLIKDAYYDGDGSLERYTTFEYDNQGSIIKKAYYNGDDNLSVSYVNEYDEQGNLIKSEHYGSDDVLFEIELYEYDSSGNKTMYSRCYADGSNPYREEFTYDVEGNNTKLITYGSKGQLLKRYEYEYKYIPGDDE